jgi:hypothetical protein
MEARAPIVDVIRLFREGDNVLVIYYIARASRIPPGSRPASGIPAALAGASSPAGTAFLGTNPGDVSRCRFCKGIPCSQPRYTLVEVFDGLARRP